MGKYYAVLLVVAIAGSQIALVGIVRPEFAGVTAADAEPPTPRPTDQEALIAVEIARLGSSNKSECAAAVQALIKIGKPAAPALVKALGDPRNDVRAYAAECMRSIFAADPTGSPNYQPKAYWEQRVAQLKPGMTSDEALQLLMPERSPAERRTTLQGKSCMGVISVNTYRLDDYWKTAIYSFDERRSPLSGREGVQRDSDVDLGRGKLSPTPPVLVQDVRQVWVSLPAGYTGLWVIWHVNGQKASEIQYRNGQPDGTLTAFYDDGAKLSEQHYIMGICHGTITGWHRNGNKSDEGQYDHGKEIGTWRRWNENGQVTHIEEYKGGGKRGGKTDK